ncbi:MAG TPA: helix-turn-helix transcriptional regulator [Chitinophagaceae bacterium]|jgi:transcriptional regulator with XRE-family HTH domain
MKKENKGQQHIAKELPDVEMEKLLLEIGKLIKAMREDRTTLERFAYEINISRSQMSKYEAGGDMFLSTFLRLLHGLGTNGEDFFKELQKTRKQLLT